MPASAIACWSSETRCVNGSSAALPGLCVTTTCSRSKSGAARRTMSRCPSVTGSKEPGITATRGMIRSGYTRMPSALVEERAGVLVAAALDRGTQRRVRLERRIRLEQGGGRVARGLDDVAVAGDPQQLQLRPRARLGGAEHVA